MLKNVLEHIEFELVLEFEVSSKAYPKEKIKNGIGIYLQYVHKLNSL